MKYIRSVLDKNKFTCKLYYEWAVVAGYCLLFVFQ